MIPYEFCIFNYHIFNCHVPGNRYHFIPVPFEFTGYIPLENDAWIPLHMYISDQFRESTHQKIMERIPKIQDAAFIDFLKGLGREE